MRVFLFLLFLALPGAAWAQQVIALDPTSIAYSPRLLELRGCGFSIGVDPSWTHRAKSVGNGIVEHIIDGEGLAEGALGTFLDEFAGPTLDMIITCEPSEPTSNRGRTAYNKTLADGMRQNYADHGQSVSSLSAVRIGPFVNGYRFEWPTKTLHQRFGILTAINGNIFAHVGNTRVHVFYRHGGFSGPESARKLAAGTIVPASRSVHVKLLAPLVMMDSGAMFPVRSIAMEQKMMTRILSTIR